MNARFAFFSGFAAASIVACGSAFSTGDSASATSTGGASTTTTTTPAVTTVASTGGGGSSVDTTSNVSSSGAGGAGCFASGASCVDPACGDVLVCEPPAPVTDWTPPMLVATAKDKASLPSCPNYAPAQTDLVELVTPVPDRGCKCHCDDGSGSCKATVIFANSPDCIESTKFVTDGTCMQLGAQSAELYFSNPAEMPTTSGTCPVSVTAAAAPELIQDHARFCAGDTLGGCEGTSCLPIHTKDFSVCIAATGDVACATPYTTKTLVYDETVTDDRTCDLGTCACGAASPAGSGANGCGGTITLYDDTGCAGSVIGTVGDSCKQQNAPPGSVLYTVPNQTCMSSGAPSVLGQVDTSGERTVCCLP